MVVQPDRFVTSLVMETPKTGFSHDMAKIDDSRYCIPGTLSYNAQT